MPLTPWLGTQQQQVTQGFGVCELAGDCPHTGIDVGAAAGTPIIDQVAGVVRDLVNAGGFGNEQVIDTAGGQQIILGHESAFAVPSGAQVTPGQVIGFVGSTGFSTGPHLHFQENIGGKPVDPSALLFGPAGGVAGGAQLLGTGPGGIPTPGDLMGAVEQGVLAAAGQVAGAVGTGIGQGLSAAAGTVGHGLANAAAGMLQNAETFLARNLVAFVVAALVAVVLFL